MTKPYTVSYDAAAGHVTVRVVGSATHEDHCAARDEAVLLCKRNACFRLLVDLGGLSTVRSSTVSCFSFGASLANEPQHYRIAHVLPRDVKSAADVRFTSTVEANRGITSGEFQSIEEAEQWLREGP